MLAPWIDTKHIQICSPELSLNALLNRTEQLMKNYQLNGGWLFQLIMQRENGAWTSIEVLNWTIKAGIMEKNRNRATLLNTYIWK